MQRFKYANIFMTIILSGISIIVSLTNNLTASLIKKMVRESLLIFLSFCNPFLEVDVNIIAHIIYLFFNVVLGVDLSNIESIILRFIPIFQL